MKLLYWTIIFSFVIGLGFLSLNRPRISLAESSSLTKEMNKVFEKQALIDAKLKEVEHLVKEIKFRVYRHTGFGEGKPRK